MMSIGIAMSIQFGPSDRIIVVASSSFHSPDGASDKGEDNNPSGDTDTDDGTSRNAAVTTRIVRIGRLGAFS